MTTLMEAAALRAAITSAESAPALVTAEEILPVLLVPARARVHNDLHLAERAAAVAALVAERTAVAVAAARAEERERAAGIARSWGLYYDEEDDDRGPPAQYVTDRIGDAIMGRHCESPVKVKCPVCGFVNRGTAADGELRCDGCRAPLPLALCYPEAPAPATPAARPEDWSALQLGMTIGRGTVTEFLDEPNTGLALLRETESGRVFDVPCWLLVLVRTLQTSVGVAWTEVERLRAEAHNSAYDAHVMAPWSADEWRALTEANAALVADVERLRAAADDAYRLTQLLAAEESRTEALRAWEAEARAAMEDAAAWADHADTCLIEMRRERGRPAAESDCDCYRAALRAVLARKVGP